MVLLVGSKPCQPSTGHHTETQAWEASVPVKSGSPRRYPLTYRAGSSSERRQAIIRCAKSWHTPWRDLKTSSTGVVTVVARLSYLNSSKIRRERSFRSEEHTSELQSR